MRNCKEFFLDDLTAIVAIPLANISASDIGSVVNSLSPVISGSFSPSLTGAITIGIRPANENGILIPIKRDTGKATDKESDDVAGRSHTVSASCQVDDRNADTWTHLFTLEREPRHLILTFRGGERAFVAATQDTYTCNVERDGENTGITFTIHNLIGFKLIS